jgi:hypothetical protein
MQPYTYIDYTSPVKCPPRLPNGGLYTGETAKGPWGNFPVIPEQHIMLQNLLSANPPPGAEKIPITTERPGNNHIQLPYHGNFSQTTNIHCITR